MLSLQQHIDLESARWAASRGRVAAEAYEESVITSSSCGSSTDSVFSRTYLSSAAAAAANAKARGCRWKKLQPRYRTHRLSRRSSTSSFATEIEREAEGQGQGQGFVVPRDFNGEPIAVYASLEAAAQQSISRLAPSFSSSSPAHHFSPIEGGGGEGFNSTTTTTTASGGGGDDAMMVGQGFEQGYGYGHGQGLQNHHHYYYHQPRRLVTPGKLYENEEDDDEIIYE